LIVGTILVEVVNLQSFGWTLGLVIPWQDLAVLVVWIAVACTLAGLAPAAAAHRLEPAAVLREER
jgi:putative ABC transport system permease protein